MSQHAATMGRYAQVNGIELFYQIHGSGQPLILLHGGFGNGDMFSAITPLLAEHYQVITVDLYGHGRTALTDRPFQFTTMGDDIAALIHHLGFEQASILGYSLGGAVALQTAIRHPEVVGKLIVLSTPFSFQGWFPEVRQNLAQLDPNILQHTPMYGIYQQLAPKPEDFSKLVLSMRNELSSEYNWYDQVAALTMPVLLLIGDADAIPPAHIGDFFALLGGGQRDAGWDGSQRPASQLAILPNTTHYTISSRADLLLPILLPFLA